MKKNGFTLFELLITISIIGILTAIATISFSSAQKKGRDARRIQDMENIRVAAEQYYSLAGAYPSVATVVGFTGDLVGVGGSGVLQSWPLEPKSGVGYTNVSDGWTDEGYCVCALLEDTTRVNSNSNCNFGSPNKNYYCVKSQQ